MYSQRFDQNRSSLGSQKVQAVLALLFLQLVPKVNKSKHEGSDAQNVSSQHVGALKYSQQGREVLQSQSRHLFQADPVQKRWLKLER